MSQDPPFSYYNYNFPAYNSFASTPPMAAFEYQSSFKPAAYPQTLVDSPSIVPSLTDMPSTVSSASSVSVPSAASSAVGSPDANASNVYAPHDSWLPQNHGLGFPPGIVSMDNFAPDSFVSTFDPSALMVGSSAKYPDFVDPHVLHPLPASEDDAYFGQTQHAGATSPTPSHSSHHSAAVAVAVAESTQQGDAKPSPQECQPQDREPRRNSPRHTASQSPKTASDTNEDGGREKGRCPYADCGKVFRDLKAHMLTHQLERPEKCPIPTCEYNQKGFARKYDKNRHTLTHYKGTMVCGFCPGSGSYAEKSFNRADVFKRHLTSVHGVEQTPPNSRRKSPLSQATRSRRTTGYCQDATGKCSTCSGTFHNAQDFYEHLDDCVLRVVQQIEPSEAINARKMAEMADDKDVLDTLVRHMLPTTLDEYTHTVPAFGDEDADEMDDADADDGSDACRSKDRCGKGSIKVFKLHPIGGASAGATSTMTPIAPALGKNGITKKTSRRKGLTYSKGGVALIDRGRKKRRNYPPSWGLSPENMKIKKRVLCVFDGQRRLWKDEMMLDNQYEIRLPLASGNRYVTDLDVKTLQRAEAIHNATEEEKGGEWVTDDLRDNMSNFLT